MFCAYVAVDKEQFGFHGAWWLIGRTPNSPIEGACVQINFAAVSMPGQFCSLCDASTQGNNNNNKSIYIAPWFQVTLFKGADTSFFFFKTVKKIKIMI